MKFTTYRQWHELPESSKKLFEECEQESLFYSRFWLENMSRYTVNKGQSLLLACVLDNEKVLALLPLIDISQGNLKPISNNLTTRFSLLMRKGIHHDDALSCLAAGLSQLDVQSLRLEPVDPEDTLLHSLQKHLEHYQFQTHRHFRFYNWTHPVDGQSFDDYMSERPGGVRSTVRRKQRKLEREQDYNIKLYTDNDIEQAQADYDAVYLKSWKASEALSDFTPELVKQFSEFGWLRLAILYIEDQPVAAQIWFVVYAKASIYRLVYDQDWQRYSPGSILTHYLMKQVIEIDQVKEINFLNGNEPYKQDWMSVRNERWSLSFIRPVKSGNWFQKILKRS